MTKATNLKFLGICMVAGLLDAARVAGAAELSDQQRLIEQMKIEELLARSVRAFDTKDVDGWIATFTPDGEWNTQYVTCKGPAALRAYLTKGFNCIGVPGGAAVPGAPPPPYSARNSSTSANSAVQSSALANSAGSAGNAKIAEAPVAARAGGSAEHFVSWPMYEFIDANTVHYTAYWATISGGSENVGGRIMSVGHYDDTLVKVNGKWLIKQRQLKH